MRAGAWTAVALGIAAALYFAWPDEQPAAPASFDIENDAFVLDTKVQEYVWEIESYAHFLQMEVAPVLARAWKEKDSEPWLRYLAKDFVATVAAKDSFLFHDHGPVGVSLWKEGDAALTLDRAKFVDFISTLGGPPEQGPSLPAIHIDDLKPVDYGNFDGPWTGTWTVLGRAGVSWRVEQMLKVRVRYARLSKNPAEDRHWIQSIDTVRHEVRSGKRQFEDITATSGIDTKLFVDTWKRRRPTVFFCSYLLDYDRDGRLDLFFLDERYAYLYRALGGGKFKDVTLEAGLLAREGVFKAATVADLDNDGYEDLLIDVALGKEQHPIILRNKGDGAFERVPGELPDVPVGNGCVADFDGDALVDLYLPNSGTPVADRNERARWIGDRTGPQGMLLKNLGGFRFRDITQEANAGGGNREILGAAWTDLEPDGDPDLVLFNHMGKNAVLKNRGDGTFDEIAFARRFGGFSMGLALGDLDNDGDPDAYVANMSSRAGRRVFQNLRLEDYPPGMYDLMYGWIDGNEFLRNDAGSFEVMGVQTAGWAYGPALADFDGDGLLDVYCPCGYQSVDLKGPDG